MATVAWETGQPHQNTFGAVHLVLCLAALFRLTKLGLAGSAPFTTPAPTWLFGLLAHLEGISSLVVLAATLAAFGLWP